MRWVTLLLFSFLYGQIHPRLETCAGMEFLRYRGDLLDKKASWERFNAGGVLHIEFEAPRRATPYFSFGWGTLRAENRTLAQEKPIYNTYFSTTYRYITLQVKIRIRKKSRLYPFFAPGIGFFFFTPKDAEGKSLVEQLQTRNEGEDYPTNAFMFPLQIGLHYRVSHHVHIELYYKVLNPQTDYIDNIGQLGNDPKKDQVSGFGIQFGFLFREMEKRGRESK